MAVHFENFVLNPDTRVLLRDGEMVKLQPKVMDLLLVLVENHQRFVSKAELHESLWGSLHVGNASLLRLIRELRRALGDDGNNPHFVRTLHGRGYQFIAPVEHRRATDVSNTATVRAPR